MALALISTPKKTVEGIVSNVSAGRSQLPFSFTTTEQAEDEYKINIEVLDDADQPIIDLIFGFSPKPDGTLFVDLKQILIEWHEFNGLVFKNFKIRYYDSWTGTSNPPVLDPTIFASVYSERQIAKLGGSNMWDNLADKTILRNLSTKFLNPFIWRNFKRTVSVLTDEGLVARGIPTLQLTTQEADINKTLIGSYIPDNTNIPIDPALEGYTIASGPTVSDNVEYMNVKVNTAGVLAYQELNYKYQEVCENPIYIEWLNDLGGYDQHLFAIQQEVSIQSNEGLKSERFISQDYQTVQTTKLRVSDVWTQVVIVKAENLTRDQMLALIDIKKSPDIRLALDSVVSKFVNIVMASDYTSAYQTDHETFDVTFGLEMPNNFDLFEAIDYSPPVSKAFLAVAFSDGFN